MKYTWKDSIVYLDDDIRTAMEVLNGLPFHIVLVVDRNHKLIGTVTDGDIRRGLLSNSSMDAPISSVMNDQPIFIKEDYDKTKLIPLMQKKGVQQIPIVSNDGIVVGLEYIESLLRKKEYDNTVFLMAGGVGKRLRDLTKKTPKPLLKVGGQPILENIIEIFVEQGFKNFTISLGYLGDKIKDYFKDGSNWSCNIEYTYETKPLGTAGALSLMKNTPNKPVIVMNGDVLTKVNFPKLLDYHHQEKSIATMCVREEEFILPYGVVNSEDSKITSIHEKPKKKYLVNSGIYVLDPCCLDLIPKSEFFDMTLLFSKIIQNNLKASPYLLHEYWIDVGMPEQFEKAIKDYSNYSE